MNSGGENFYEDMNLRKGFPVFVTEFNEYGGIEEESTLKRTFRQRIDPDAFEPPKGYRLRTMGPQ